MYEAVILEPWASCGVAHRIAEVDMVLARCCFQDLVNEDAEGSVHLATRGMKEGEVKDLAERGIDGALAGAQHLLEGPDLSNDCELTVE